MQLKNLIDNTVIHLPETFTGSEKPTVMGAEILTPTAPRGGENSATSGATSVTHWLTVPGVGVFCL